MLKIKSIKFKDHKIFGNKEIDFTLYNDEIAENIIIVGENGSGKTRFLKELLNFKYIDSDDKNHDEFKLNQIMRELKFIDYINVELKFNRNDILIPKIDLKDVNLNNLNDIYIMSNWKEKFIKIKKIDANASDEAIIKHFFDYSYQKNYFNFMKYFNSQFYPKFLESDIDQDSIVNYKEWISSISKMKNDNVKINFKMSNLFEKYFNIKKTIIKKNNEKFIFSTDGYFKIDQISLNIQSLNNFNSIIFWYDEIQNIWNKNENLINKLIDNKIINLVEPKFEKEKYITIGKNIDSNENESLRYLEIKKIIDENIIDKNYFYENTNIIENTHEWIKQKVNNVLNNSNLSHHDNNIQTNISKALEPLILSIKNFFNNNIEINRVNWDNSNIKNVLFMKNNTDIHFKDLSSGEKLILSICISILNKINILEIYNNQDESLVRRDSHYIFTQGFYELKSSHNILLFDEIESGLHPKWQSKILNLIKETSQGVGQRFLTTHSPIICYSINPETDIIINLNDNNKKISFKNYNSIDELVNKTLNFDYKDLTDQYNVWVEGETDKLYFDIAKKQIKDLMPFNIIANKNSKDDSGAKGWSGSGFIFGKLLPNFIFGNSEENKNKPLIAIVDGDILNNEYSMESIIKKCPNKKEDVEDYQSNIKTRDKIKNNIKNWDILNEKLKNSKNDKTYKYIIPLEIKNKANKIFKLIILKKNSIEWFLKSSDENLQFWIEIIKEYKKYSFEDIKKKIANHFKNNDEKNINELNQDNFILKIKQKIQFLINDNKKNRKISNLSDVKKILIEIKDTL